MIFLNKLRIQHSTDKNNSNNTKYNINSQSNECEILKTQEDYQSIKIHRKNKKKCTWDHKVINE